MAAHQDTPRGAEARVDTLFTGYADTSATPFSVASSITLVREGDLCIVVDPGFVPDRKVLIDRLVELGEDTSTITDVVLSHHHPDHTANAALFPDARLHDFWAVYFDDTWTARPAEGLELSGSVRLIETPGHTPQDITTLVGTADGVVALTHLWWTPEGPDEDPFASDMTALRAGRARVLEVAALIVPGHGAAFRPQGSTPR